MVGRAVLRRSPRPDSRNAAGGVRNGGALCRVVDPRTSPLCENFAELYAKLCAKLRADKGMTVELGHDVVVEGSYFGTLMVHEGLADCMVSGAAHSTAAAILVR